MMGATSTEISITTKATIRIYEVSVGGKIILMK